MFFQYQWIKVLQTLVLPLGYTAILG
ncbi:hypothetical protein HNR53_004394 [Bacillus benzoevorans]|uniref:Uncharacterized protein n=1 Tax=Bacillus benzoevorans TaxID=1456 RepID=A0A7X0LXE8_9BACI|nr:hypothetical protein [Bacillus benzoevorans]